MDFGSARVTQDACFESTTSKAVDLLRPDPSFVVIEFLVIQTLMQTGGGWMHSELLTVFISCQFLMDKLKVNLLKIGGSNEKNSPSDIHFVPFGFNCV